MATNDLLDPKFANICILPDFHLEIGKIFLDIKLLSPSS